MTLYLYVIVVGRIIIHDMVPSALYLYHDWQYWMYNLYSVVAIVSVYELTLNTRSLTEWTKSMLRNIVKIIVNVVFVHKSIIRKRKCSVLRYLLHIRFIISPLRVPELEVSVFSYYIPSYWPQCVQFAPGCWLSLVCLVLYSWTHDFVVQSKWKDAHFLPVYQVT